MLRRTRVLRRTPFALPYAAQLPALAALLAGDRAGRVEDPAALAEAARHHRVEAYVADALDAERIELSPAAERDVRSGAAIGALHSRATTLELAAVVPVLARACGAPPILVKGPSLARLYPSPRLRPFADLDLLLPRASLEAGVAALAAEGWDVVVEFNETFGLEHGHDVHLRRHIGMRTLDLELHWRIGDDPIGGALAWEALRREARTMELAGIEVSAPDAADELQILALHLLSDRSKRLCWVHDLALAARAADEQEWERAFGLAGERGLGWVLHRALDYAAAHLDLRRRRPAQAGPPPPWGPLRAVEELDMRASLHVGRLAALPWAARPRYVREVLVPTGDGLRGTVGEDGAPTWRLALRHARQTLRGLAGQRR